MLPSLETVVGELGCHLPALGLVAQRAPCRAQGTQWIRTLCLEQETSDRYRHLAPGRVPWLLVRWASGSRVPGTLVTRLRICGTLRQIS